LSASRRPGSYRFCLRAMDRRCSLCPSRVIVHPSEASLVMWTAFGMGIKLTHQVMW